MKTSGPPGYTQPFLNQLNPDEVHNIGGDCINPKCPYEFTSEDKDWIDSSDGAWTCPNCDTSYNYFYNDPSNYFNPGGATRAGLTPKQMGNIGENVIAGMGEVPMVGSITWHSPDYTNPIDFIIGPYGCEVKTNHSEASPRFKLGNAYERLQKIQAVEKLGLKQGFVGVRLNFYTNKADIFFRPQFTDTWIGNPQLSHVAKVDFRDLNPYKDPSQVPPPSLMPGDDSDIPF